MASLFSKQLFCGLARHPGFSAAVLESPTFGSEYARRLARFFAAHMPASEPSTIR